MRIQGCYLLSQRRLVEIAPEPGLKIETSGAPSQNLVTTSPESREESPASTSEVAECGDASGECEGAPV